MISLKNICFSYRNQGDGSLADINFTVEEGECILLCGRSGCGKTTVTRLMNGLIPHFYDGNFQGEALVNKMDIGQTPMYRIAEKVGSVFQNPRTQFFNVDTDSEIAFGIENNGVPREELKKKLETAAKDLKIEKLLDRNIFELSGGEKQKIAFASVYAMNPEVYLLDEPSSNLDMKAIAELKEILTLIKKQGKTIFIAEHRLYYLMDLADRILFFDQGRIEKEFTPKTLKQVICREENQLGLRTPDLTLVHPSYRKFSVLETALEIQDLTLSHKKRVILEHISLKASCGEVIAIAGDNGAGKSTFSRALCGLHKEFTGNIFWKGQQQDRKKCLKRSYMVMQDVNYQLFAESVKAECSFGIKNPDLSLVEETMDELGILPFKERHPNTLSGGQKQRLAVAVSMIGNKELLVFDEPTSGLDYESMCQVSGLIEKLSNKGKVIFVVTHDYEFICQTCSRVLYFQEGSMKEDLLVSPENEGKLRSLFGI